MARGTKQMQPALELEARLEKQIAELQKQLEGVRMAIRALRGESDKPAVRSPRPNVKQIILSLLEEVGKTGLNATMAVEQAAKRNEQIERPTVSSLLSRFKSDGLVTYDGSVYRLKKYSASASSEGAQAMH